MIRFSSISCSHITNFDRNRVEGLAYLPGVLQSRASGEMDEWLKSHAWKACIG